MIKVRISELKNKLSHYLKLVQGGEELEILDRNRPIARVVKISGAGKSAASARLRQMEEDGLVQPGSGKLVPILLTKPPGTGAGVLRAVLEEREGR